MCRNLILTQRYHNGLFFIQFFRCAISLYNEPLRNLTPEARTYKRTRGRVRAPEEKKALVLAAGKAWNEWLSSGKLVKTDKGYELYKI